MDRFHSFKTWQAWLVAAILTSSGTVLVGDVDGGPQDFFVDTSVLAAPNADEVIVYVPSAFHWSRYQQGTLGEFTYTIYPDGSAKVMSGRDRLIEEARIDCVAAQMCSVVMADGTSFTVPVEQGLRPTLRETFDTPGAATYVARWILTGTAPEVVEEPPQAAPVPPENKPPETSLANSDENAAQPVIEAAIELTEVSSDPNAVNVADGNPEDAANFIVTPDDSAQDPVEDVAEVEANAAPPPRF